MSLTEEIDALSVLAHWSRRRSSALACSPACSRCRCSRSHRRLGARRRPGRRADGRLAVVACDWRNVPDFLHLADAIPATLKTSVFGATVGLVGCWTGLNAERSTEGVGLRGDEGRRPIDARGLRGCPCSSRSSSRPSRRRGGRCRADQRINRAMTPMAADEGRR